jgi:hypothetical protein
MGSVAQRAGCVVPEEAGYHACTAWCALRGGRAVLFQERLERRQIFVGRARHRQ